MAKPQSPATDALRLAMGAAAAPPGPTGFSGGRASYDLELVGRGFADPDGPVEAGAEIVAHDAEADRLYVTNAAAGRVDAFDLGDDGSVTKAFDFAAAPLDPALYGITSVAVSDDLVAVAIERDIEQNPAARGFVGFYEKDGAFAGLAAVGNGPDSVAFASGGAQLVVADEGEVGERPGDGEVVDPRGSISIVDASTFEVSRLSFARFDGREDELREAGVRITAGIPASRDLEPEAVAISGDGRTAAITLQENSAVALLDLETNALRIVGLGSKDHDLPGNGFDASDEDGGINIRRWPVQGLYQPDGVSAFEVGGATYWAVSNEGDARDAFGEVESLADAVEGGLVALDPLVFGNQEFLLAEENLGALEIFVNEGDTDGDGDLDVLYSQGARSFSILNEDGEIVFDSGSQLERLTARLLPANFNADNDENDSFDSRSDNKGPEPEGLVTGVVDGRTFAFVGLERIGGVAVYEVTDPEGARFVQYVNSRDFTAADGTLAAGDLGPEGLAFVPAEASPTGEALLAVAHEISGTTAVYEFEAPFRLQLLHAGDLEGGVDTLDFAPNFAAIVDRLEDLEANTLVVSAGDNFIPGPFFNAASDPSLGPVLTRAFNELFGLPRDVDGDGDGDAYAAIQPGVGRADIAIMNAIGFDASVLGNHELDAGTSAFQTVIAASFGLDRGTLADDAWTGALFPYLSANVDFSGDPALAPLFTSGILPTGAYRTGPAASLNPASPTAKLAEAATFEVGGETIGVVGATTQLLENITSAGGLDVEGRVEGRDGMRALAEVLQPVIDDLRADGVNKIVLTTQLQQISNELRLATLLDGVDVIVAGGSNTILADGGDDLLPGDVRDARYPLVRQSASGEDVLIVSTDGNYEYVGRLVVEFDADGRVVLDSLERDLKGPIASTEANVEALWGDLDDAFAEGTRGNIVRDVARGVDAVIASQDGNVFGVSDVFLEGRRDFVRSEETNLGDLTADANLAYARAIDDTVEVSIKNGGGIRFQIGEVGEGGALLPNPANPDAGKPEGGISQLDIANSLRFNNALSLLTVTTEGLLQVIEEALEGVAPGATPGAFPQVGGLAFSFDPGSPVGSRVESMAIIDEAGDVVRALVDDGEVLASAAGDEIRLVTLSFLADGSDGYPFPDLAEDRVDLGQPGVRTGGATFADDGTEQDAFAEYVLAEFPVGGDAFDVAETGREGDARIQNLDFRADTIDDMFV